MRVSGSRTTLQTRKLGGAQPGPGLSLVSGRLVSVQTGPGQLLWSPSGVQVEGQSPAGAALSTLSARPRPARVSSTQGTQEAKRA